ncbi:hypothetical protein P152DRAFT_460182 [Eremomyces bilateralis CBS 781.70]|uniref:Dynein light intermediate chain n=1 Tax=Eremomyces bilateralis CBS 781.70 TaxID=1392243 RepID=A0A6G1FYP2_9PEZI|nr:uncharacterized protein P152DRAFT_460182 [Eremomyces bilateralis CBS 781.70]KAF1810888.1 hypothetical protein P152DRAFT_460182 [Eremomyces bilateralis CBS 781.70]
MASRPPRSSTGASTTTTAQPPSIWSSLLDAASTSKRLPNKTLLILGGTPNSQRDFLTSLTHDPASSRNRPLNNLRNTTNPSNPLANDLALGYTYHDVLDADQEDVLARVGCYMVSDPADEALVPLARKVVLSKDAVDGGMCVVLLLDWARPWEWLRKLRGWIRWVRILVDGADDEVKEVMEAEVRAWRERKRGPGAEASAGERPGTAGSDVVVPLGPGEWDSPLGLPLCVVAQNAEAIEGLERERGWREEEFDFVLQVLRTVLLKHGAGLVYTMSSPQASAPMRDLVHAMLGIQSMLKRSQLKHNVIDRDQVLVPPNWDSWGKIRVLREGLDVEEVSKIWDLDIDASSPSNSLQPSDQSPSDSPDHSETSSVLALYKSHIPSPRGTLGTDLIRSHATSISVSAPDNQVFLEQQRSILDKLQGEDEKEKANKPKASNAGVLSSIVAATTESAGGRVVEDHIGPVQFNFGGVNVDAEEEIRRIEEREASRAAPKPDAPATPITPTTAKSEAKSDMDNKELSKFFSALKAKTGGSPASSPKA